MRSFLCNIMVGPRRYYAKGNKSDWEWQIPHEFTCMWNLKKQTNKWISKQSSRISPCPSWVHLLWAEFSSGHLWVFVFANLIYPDKHTYSFSQSLIISIHIIDGLTDTSRKAQGIQFDEKESETGLRWGREFQWEWQQREEENKRGLVWSACPLAHLIPGSWRWTGRTSVFPPGFPDGMLRSGWGETKDWNIISAQ